MLWVNGQQLLRALRLIYHGYTTQVWVEKVLFRTAHSIPSRVDRERAACTLWVEGTPVKLTPTKTCGVRSNARTLARNAVRTTSGVDTTVSPLIAPDPNRRPKFNLGDWNQTECIRQPTERTFTDCRVFVGEEQRAFGSDGPYQRRPPQAQRARG